MRYNEIGDMKVKIAVQIFSTIKNIRVDGYHQTVSMVKIGKKYVNDTWFEFVK